MGIHIDNYQVLSKRDGTSYAPVKGEEITFTVISAKDAKAAPKNATLETYLNDRSKAITVHVQYIHPSWGPGITRVQGYTIEPTGSLAHVIAHYGHADTRPIIGIMETQSHQDD